MVQAKEKGTVLPKLYGRLGYVALDAGMLNVPELADKFEKLSHQHPLEAIDP